MRVADTRNVGIMANQKSPDDTQESAPTGGDQTTEDQLEADNEVEADTLKTLDPDAAPA